MLIIENENDRQKCTSAWGNDMFVLTREEVAALLAGKTLGNPDYSEYGTLISMEK